MTLTGGAGGIGPVPREISEECKRRLREVEQGLLSALDAVEIVPKEETVTRAFVSVHTIIATHEEGADEECRRILRDLEPHVGVLSPYRYWTSPQYSPRELRLVLEIRLAQVRNLLQHTGAE
jgi:hypothetical protein